MQKLSVIIITYNEETQIRATLEAVKWCDEIIVVDSHSKDKTVDICNEYANCKVYTNVFKGYSNQKKFALEKVSNDWVLSIDADEVLSDLLQKEISTLFSKPIANAAFQVPITLVFMNKKFHYGSENKNYHLRLFNKNQGSFIESDVHEGVQVKGKISKLKNEIVHYSYKDIHHYLLKFNEYTSLYANQAIKRGKKTNVLKVCFRFCFEFLMQYFIRLNFLNAYPGFVWSVLSSFYVFVKFIKIQEKNNS